MRTMIQVGLILAVLSCGEDEAKDTSTGGGGSPEPADDSAPLDTPPDEDVDEDGDGISIEEGDCDDDDENIHPYADEICDEVDNDCDGAVDDDDASIDPDTQSQWYADADEDGYGAEAYTLLGCVAPEGYVAPSDEGFDCNDLDDTYYPGADESCEEAADRNCDGSVAYEDADSDGWAACLECNDADATSYPGATEVCDGVDNDCDHAIDDEDEDLDESTRSVFYADLDLDGYGDETHPIRACEAPEGTVPESDDAFDCDDSDPDISPEAEEVCDGVDNDCNDEIDDGVEEGTSTFYMDADMDGYGDPDAAVVACTAPAGAVTVAGDCDDHDNDIHPGVLELCDGEDNDCDGTTDGDDAVDAVIWYVDADLDGYGDPSDSITSCTPIDGYVSRATDCDDADASISPAAVETCNGIDDNCDGATDEDTAVDAVTWYPDEDGDGYGDGDSPYLRCTGPAGYLTDAGDCDDSDASISPDGEEGCNGEDDDCDGTVDGADATDPLTWYVDADGDGYGSTDMTALSCTAPDGYVADASDCDDTDPSVHSDSGSSGTETFDYTGSGQTFTVPICVGEIQITAYGAEGKSASTTGSSAGRGGMAQGTLSVSGGETLYVYVGGDNGYNGGGDSWSGSSQVCNGGGASDVRFGGVELTDRIIVAGGGGGVSGETSWGDGGDGGGGSCGSNYCGGETGYGYSSGATSGGAYGGSGTSGCHGGAGGGGGEASGGGGSVATCYSGATAGTGTLGGGGNGNAASSGCCHGYGSAGGGGGYYGGGGSAGGCCGSGGAGGGSSWTGSLSAQSFSSGTRSGDGRVVITW